MVKMARQQSPGCAWVDDGGFGRGMIQFGCYKRLLDMSILLIMLRMTTASSWMYISMVCSWVEIGGAAVLRLTLPPLTLFQLACWMYYGGSGMSFVCWMSLGIREVKLGNWRETRDRRGDLPYM
jgi:hypothetical protein